MVQCVFIEIETIKRKMENLNKKKRRTNSFVSLSMNVLIKHDIFIVCLYMYVKTYEQIKENRKLLSLLLHPLLLQFIF